jgi:hypothetical protein
MDGRLWNEPDRTSCSGNRVCTPHRTTEEWICSRNGWIRIAHRRRDRHASLFTWQFAIHAVSCSLDLGDLWRPRSPILPVLRETVRFSYVICIRHLYPFDILGTFLILSRLARSRYPFKRRTSCQQKACVGALQSSKAPMINTVHNFCSEVFHPPGI